MAVVAFCWVASCSEPLEFADWSIPVPEGSRIIEYPAIPTGERIERLDFVEDLVIGRGADDTNYNFYGARGLAVDRHGRIYVLDSGNARVQVFDQDGRFLRTIGRSGQGPGEFQSASSIAVAGGRLLITDTWDRRLRIWNLEGELLQDEEGPAPETLTLVQGLEDESFIATYQVIERWTSAEGRRGSSAKARVPVLVDPDGGISRPFVELPISAPVYHRDGLVAMPRVPFARPRVAASSTGDVYAIRGDEYQVLAYSKTGELRWALRASGRTPPLPEAHIDAAFSNLAISVEIERSDIDWPERLPALSDLYVDGKGNLYVFPYVYVPWGGEPPDEVPVDVYSPAGERLFAGMMPAHYWRAALGECVYCLEVDADSEEQIVIRYRLVRPF
jgi:hypothetical protein